MDVQVAAHPAEEQLGPDERMVMRTILLAAPIRAKMPNLTDQRYLEVAYGLMAKDLLQVVQVDAEGTQFRVELTLAGKTAAIMMRDSAGTA